MFTRTHSLTATHRNSQKTVINRPKPTLKFKIKVNQGFAELSDNILKSCDRCADAVVEEKLRDLCGDE